jgi:hypothetical protein
MKIYSDENCRNCDLANWTWSDRVYPEGRKRIIVQHSGACRAAVSEAGVEQRKEPLDARQPFGNCSSWELADNILG